MMSEFDQQGETQPISLPELQASVERQLSDAVARLANLSDLFLGIPISYTIRCRPLDILRWLGTTMARPRFYWRTRDGHREVGGAGTALVVSPDNAGDVGVGLNRITEFLSLQSGNPLLRFFGGTRFDVAGTSDQRWSKFHQFWFVLPQLIITRELDGYYLTLTTLWDGKSGVDDIRIRLLESLDLFLHVNNQGGNGIPRVIGRRDTPDRQRWDTIVREILSGIASGRVVKVVSARRTELTASGYLNPFALTETLIRRQQPTYGFLFEPAPGSAFFGVSPEQLFGLKDRILTTEAIAGTALSGATEMEVSANAARLIGSSKDRLEQQFVADGLRAKLADLCDTFADTGDPQVLRLTTLQHLITRFQGTIKPEVTLGDIYRAIHPTAAVCGTPQAEALELLTALEGFDRGWYASGVGVISSQEAEFAVAIRSGVFSRNTISLFAGVGVVDGSDPETEWQELERKIAPALELFAKDVE